MSNHTHDETIHLTAWRETLSHLDVLCENAIHAYVNRCQVGGMKRKHAVLIRQAAQEACTLHYFRDAIAAHVHDTIRRLTHEHEAKVRAAEPITETLRKAVPGEVEDVLAEAKEDEAGFVHIEDELVEPSVADMLARQAAQVQALLEGEPVFKTRRKPGEKGGKS